MVYQAVEPLLGLVMIATRDRPADAVPLRPRLDTETQIASVLASVRQLESFTEMLQAEIRHLRETIRLGDDDDRS